MKIDLYTKSVLTVIAVCLAVIVMRDVQIISTAQAAAPKEVMNVQIVGVEQSPVHAWEVLKVKP